MLLDRKKKEKRPVVDKYRLKLFDGTMATLYSDLLQRVPLPESLILACSEEFFNDPNPCEIHRRAVMMRLYGEIIEALPMNKTLPMPEVPLRIGLYLRDAQPAFVRLETRT